MVMGWLRDGYRVVTGWLQGGCRMVMVLRGGYRAVKECLWVGYKEVTGGLRGGYGLGTR